MAQGNFVVIVEQVAKIRHTKMHYTVKSQGCSTYWTKTPNLWFRQKRKFITNRIQSYHAAKNTHYTVFHKMPTNSKPQISCPLLYSLFCIRQCFPRYPIKAGLEENPGITVTIITLHVYHVINCLSMFLKCSRDGPLERAEMKKTYINWVYRNTCV